MKENCPVILFDGVCNLCTASVRFLIKMDKNSKLKFSSQQSESGQEILKEINFNHSKLSSIIFVQGDKYHLKSSAILAVFKLLGGGFYIFYLLLFLIPKPIRDFFYDLIAKYRYKVFGKRETCMLPPDEWEDRFI